MWEWKRWCSRLLRKQEMTGAWNKAQESCRLQAEPVQRRKKMNCSQQGYVAGPPKSYGTHYQRPRHTWNYRTKCWLSYALVFFCSNLFCQSYFPFGMGVFIYPVCHYTLELCNMFLIFTEIHRFALSQKKTLSWITEKHLTIKTLCRDDCIFIYARLLYHVMQN